MLTKSTGPNHMRLCLSIRLALLLTSLLLILGVEVHADPADTDVCGPITSDTVWTPSGSPYIATCDVQVTSGVKLTIQPDVIVKFDADTLLWVDGTLIAQGCIFTSNDPAPDRDDWGGILFTTTSVDAVFDGDGNYV